ncbi:hypothetical protein R1flu_020509 [Riccia fluitans]|uniref:Uncharacterized protein n=1 Tax=Riccia fluitans TaxID=41844 RepID=A0ABD1ZLQ7_9MARC
MDEGGSCKERSITVKRNHVESGTTSNLQGRRDRCTEEGTGLIRSECIEANGRGLQTWRKSIGKGIPPRGHGLRHDGWSQDRAIMNGKTECRNEMEMPSCPLRARTLDEVMIKGGIGTS